MANLQARNPATRAAHRRQVFWQITAPFVGGVLLILFLAVLTVVSAIGDGQVVSRWADISLVWLILPSLFFALLILLFVGGAIYLLVKLIGLLPGYFFKAQKLLVSIQANLRQVSDKSVEPVLKVESFLAAGRVLLSKRSISRLFEFPGKGQKYGK